MLRQNLISLYIGIWNVFPQVHRSSIFEIVWENLKSNDSYSCLSYFCGMSVNMTKSWFIQKTPYFWTAEMSHRNNVKHKQNQLTWLLFRGEVENIPPDKKHPEVAFRRLSVLFWDKGKIEMLHFNIANKFASGRNTTMPWFAQMTRAFPALTVCTKCDKNTLWTWPYCTWT